ncbi:hypothetical protein ACE15N_17230 [Xanthomonas campestris pv. passiflorae]|uniref:hypothetical protein n=1 Tax=Xanthomonas campestris TaxID=339 RepID=UPI002427A94E|nr:hypothetical protein [Xanthomonas campestris]MBV6815065.1 hypothetical protein [Xanthomonas campestris pv. passiflorae]
MTANKGKDATQHDDVSGLFARLGTPASQGYHDFAYTQLPPRTSSLAQADAPAAVEPIAVAPDPVQPPVGVAAPTLSLGMPVPERAPQAVVTAADQVPDALAPLRKLRQLDEPAPRGVQPADRPAQTPLERLFQRLLQADARSCAQSPLKRLRSR